MYGNGTFLDENHRLQILQCTAELL